MQLGNYGTMPAKTKGNSLVYSGVFSWFLVHCLVCKRPNDLNIYSSKIAITVHIAIPKHTNLKIPWSVQMPRKIMPTYHLCLFQNLSK